MKILMVTPAPRGSRKGNRITAVRWAGMLRQLGHQVNIVTDVSHPVCDLMVALHAKHSANALVRFRRECPETPLLLAMTGTDLYRDIHRSAAARRSMQLADRLILLQPHGIGQLPSQLQDKARVIFQSVPEPRRIPPPLRNVFEVCVVGHLRPVKDPFRVALAAGRLPRSSKIRVVQFGAALQPVMARQAEAEQQRNARYRWLGERPRWQTLQRLARSRLLVLSSKMEGGANVISEAIVASVPVLASRISGSIGLLGEDYPGYFPTGDTKSLAELMSRAETDRDFYRLLKTHCRKLKPRFHPRGELAAWRKLLAEIK